MQQVGRKAPLSAIIVDPRRLPVKQRRRVPRSLGSAKRVWILHRPLLLKLLAGLLCAGLIAAAFHGRGGIERAIANTSALLQGEFAEAGLDVSAIEISGQALLREADIVSALGLDESGSILGLDAEAARQRVLAMPAVDEVTVRKVYPNRLIISLVEKKPIARWRVDGVTFVIDGTGDQIGDAAPVDQRLPLVIGDGAADDALVIIRALERYPDLSEGLAALSRIADRRWDLIYQTGLRVQLPETGVAQALKTLNGYQRDYRLLERDVTQIDLRVDGVLAVRPATDPSLLNTTAS